MQRVMRADFHAHSADDPRDALRHSTEMLIDAAAAAGIEVLALTLHETMRPSPRLTRYAERKGVLLLPAIEQNVDGAHLLMINPDEEQARATTFADLRALGRRNAAFIAPHPYYGTSSCLGRRFIQNIDLFDAVEYCTLYGRGVNWPNRRAVRQARRHGLPVVGTSDTHALPYIATTHTRITAEKSVAGVVDALRAGRVELVTEPRPWPSLVRLVSRILLELGWIKVVERLGYRPQESPGHGRIFIPGDLHPNTTAPAAGVPAR